MNKLLLSLVIFIAVTSTSHATGWTSQAVPTSIENMRNNGFVINGTFGNANSCQRTNAIFVPKEHPQYELMYSMATSALMGGKELKAYIHACTLVGWYSQTLNETNNFGVMIIYP